MAHKMNLGPGGVQPKMHDTIIPSTGEPQSMIFASDSPVVNSKGESMACQPKGMEQVIRERGLWPRLEAGSENSKPLKTCATCKMSQEARDKAAKAAKARDQEIEGSGVEALADRYECDEEASDLDRPNNCCMQRMLSLQDDFKNEKPLLQLVIEKAGHKCLFLPKFHCELNPIEMVWGQLKRRKLFLCLFTVHTHYLQAFESLLMAHSLARKCRCQSAWTRSPPLTSGDTFGTAIDTWMRTSESLYLPCCATRILTISSGWGLIFARRHLLSRSTHLTGELTRAF